MIGHAILREIVGADTLRAVAGADLAFSVGGDGRTLLFHLGFIQPRTQNGQRLVLVFVLAALILTFHDRIGRDMRYADRRRGLVDVLTARTGCAERVDA